MAEMPKQLQFAMWVGTNATLLMLGAALIAVNLGWLSETLWTIALSVYALAGFALLGFAYHVVNTYDGGADDAL